MKENWKKNDNILIYSVKDVTQNKDYLIFLLKKRKFCVCWTIFHLKILQIYIEWKAKCMIKYTFHLLLCDIIEAIKITKRITKIKTKLPVFYAFLFFFLLYYGDGLSIDLSSILFSTPHSISVILLLHGLI